MATLSVVTGRLLDGMGNPRYMELITFELLGDSVFTIDGDQVFRKEIRVRTDSTGSFSVDLYQSSSIDADKSRLWTVKPGYRIRIPATGFERLVSVPDNTGPIDWSALEEDLDGN